MQPQGMKIEERLCGADLQKSFTTKNSMFYGGYPFIGNASTQVGSFGFYELFWIFATPYDVPGLRKQRDSRPFRVPLSEYPCGN